MDWKLELIVVPVSDVERAKAFYMEKAGFELHVDHSEGDFRVAHPQRLGVLYRHHGQRSRRLAPRTPPGRLRHLRGPRRAGATGAGPSGIFHFEAGQQQPGADPGRADYNSFCSFNDPDGNTWLVQEVTGAD